jgi:hypothetical protein
MGKTSLFSRVALSPNQTVGADKKGSGALSISKPATNQSINDNETQASSVNNTMGKTVRSNTTTTFKDAVQRGVLSGAGILKK